MPEPKVKKKTIQSLESEGMLIFQLTFDSRSAKPAEAFLVKYQGTGTQL